MRGLDSVLRTNAGFDARGLGHDVRVEVTAGPGADERTMTLYLDGESEGVHRMPESLTEYFPELPVATATVAPNEGGEALFWALAEGGSVPRVLVGETIYTAPEAVRLDDRTVLHAGIAPREIMDGPYAIPSNQEMADAGCDR
jgi:hypothetical protein